MPRNQRDLPSACTDTGRPGKRSPSAPTRQRIARIWSPSDFDPSASRMADVSAGRRTCHTPRRSSQRKPGFVAASSSCCPSATWPGSTSEDGRPRARFRGSFRCHASFFLFLFFLSRVLCGGAASGSSVRAGRLCVVVCGVAAWCRGPWVVAARSFWLAFVAAGWFLVGVLRSCPGFCVWLPARLGWWRVGLPHWGYAAVRWRGVRPCYGGRRGFG